MKLFLLTDRAVLLKGKNSQKVCVIDDGAVKAVNVTLTIGKTAIAIEDGYGVLPELNCGSVAVSFAEEGRAVYEAGVVFFGQNGQGTIVNGQDTLDNALTEATKIKWLEAELKKLKDEFIDLKGKVEYKGLDFIL